MLGLKPEQKSAEQKTPTSNKIPKINNGSSMLERALNKSNNGECNSKVTKPSESRYDSSANRSNSSSNLNGFSSDKAKFNSKTVDGERSKNSTKQEPFTKRPDIPTSKTSQSSQKGWQVRMTEKGKTGIPGKPTQSTANKPQSAIRNAETKKPDFQSKTIAKNAPQVPSNSKQPSQSKTAKKVPPKEFPPRDLKPKQFPPADVRRKAFPSKDVRRKPALGTKHRILDDDDEEYDSEMDDFIDDGPQDGEDISKHISEIFGYDRSRYRHLDDDVDNMESSFSQQMKEEFISTKIGEFQVFNRFGTGNDRSRNLCSLVQNAMIIFLSYSSDCSDHIPLM